MYINHTLKIEVAEPRNFRSYDGNNLFYCTVIDINNKENKELYLAKTNSYFEISDKKVDYVILQNRGYLDNNQYNFYIFKDKYDNNLFGDDRDVGGKIEHKMIGLVKDILP